MRNRCRQPTPWPRPYWFASRQRAGRARRQFTQARGKLDQAVAALDSARTGPQQVRIQESRALAAAALADKSQASRRASSAQFELRPLVAPVDGLVAKRSVQVGEYVAPGQELLAVVPLDDVYITANFKETQLENMRLGQRAVIYVDAYGRDYYGTSKASPAAAAPFQPAAAGKCHRQLRQGCPARARENRFDPGQNGDHLLRRRHVRRTKSEVRKNGTRRSRI